MNKSIELQRRVGRQYGQISEDEQRAFDSLLSKLARRDIYAVPLKDRKRAGKNSPLWILTVTDDLRIIVEESETLLTVKELARPGRIDLYRELAEGLSQSAEPR